MSAAAPPVEHRIVGSIGRISRRDLSGWLACDDGSIYKGRLHLLCGSSRFDLPELRFWERTDQIWAAGTPMVVGFTIEYPPIFAAEELMEAKIGTEQGNYISVWENVKIDKPIIKKSIDLSMWKELMDCYFLDNYVAMPVAKPDAILVYLLNDFVHRTFDPIYTIDLQSRWALVEALTDSTPSVLKLPLQPYIKRILKLADQEYLESLDTRVLVSLFRYALTTNVFSTPFAYEKYLAACQGEDASRIEEHCRSTGFDQLYCALVHHFHSAQGRELMDALNRWSTSMVLLPEPDRSEVRALEQIEEFRPNALDTYDPGFDHYIANGQFEPFRLNTLAPPPNFAVLRQVAKLRRLDPEIPDASGLAVTYWGTDRSKKTLLGAAKIWRAQERGRAIFPIFVPWFTYGGADKESLLLAKAIREVFVDDAEVLFILSSIGHQEDKLYTNRFNTMLLRSDKFVSQYEVEHVIQRIIAVPNVRCLINCNSMDFWQFFVKNPKMVSSLTAVATMTFCDDFNPETGGRDGWLRRYFKYVYEQNAVLLCDNARHIADYAHDYNIDTLRNVKVLNYPVTLKRRKVCYKIMGRPRLLWASRLDEQKGIATLPAVIQLLPDCEFHIFGSHVLSKPDHRLELLRSLNNVFMRGAYTDIEDVEIEEFDLFLYTAAWDGLPNILLEIGASGLPIVSSSVGGIPELLEDDSAYLVDNHDNPSAFVKRIREALASEDERRNKAERLHAIVSEKHSWSQFTKTVYEIFGEYVK